ncbi:MAG: glycosyltransferase, partial [Candidatus Woesearchaeota archaeon]
MTKNVLIVISMLKLGGGAERIASMLGTRLFDHKYNVHYLTFYKPEKEYEYKGKLKCLNDKLTYSIVDNSMKLINRAKEIAKYSKKHKIDTVISFMEESNFSVILSKILFGNKSKIICSVRTNPKRYIENSRGLREKITYYLMRILYPWADKIICLSRGVESSLNSDFNLKKTKTIHNFFEIKNKLSDNKEKKYDFITIGRLEPVKNHIGLIRSFRLVLDKKPDSNLVILGDGPLREELEHLIKKLNLGKKVILKGNVEDVYSYLKRSKVFVFSSDFEGFGNVLLEALSEGVPILSTDCEFGPREILAPELKIGEKIKYPYYGKYGILMPV